MIAGWQRWPESKAPNIRAMREALALYDRKSVSQEHSNGSGVLAGHRDFTSGALSHQVAFTGWLDNADDLAGTLNGDPRQPADLYARGLDRWGTDIDQHLFGNYAALALDDDGTMHLSRSPWDAPPLYYHLAAGHICASTLLRVMFAGGVPRIFDWDRMADELAYDWRSGDEAAWHHGIKLVPLGACVAVTPDGAATTRHWYSPPQVMPAGQYDEEACVARALDLLDEAAAKALSWAEKPALAMSGGLDSTLAASALTRALPQETRLPAITFVPDRSWKGKDEPGTMGDERPFAKLMAEAEPALEWHICSDDVGPYDKRARDVFAACEVFAPGLANVGMHHNLYEKARALGCNALLTADMGNSTISENGRAAYCEFAQFGTLSQLVKLLRERPGDTRPFWRKLLALTVLPRLPRWLRHRARALVHPARRDMTALLTPLSQGARRAQSVRAEQRDTESAWSDFVHDRSREETVAREYIDSDSSGRDIDLAFEQLYGIRLRDVFAYRPLIEFCMSLPTRAFAWDGEERRFARLMGKGRVPEEIRTNTLHGQHNVDWHARMTPERTTMREALEAARDHPRLSSMLDIDRMQALIDDWPDAPDFVWENDLPRSLALPRALLAARFAGYLDQRNDL